MDRRVVLALLVTDLRLLLRSGRTVLLSVVLPLLVFPLILLISNVAGQRQIERRESTLYRYAVLGDAAAEARSWIERVDRRLAQHEERDFHFDESSIGDPAAALEGGDLHFTVHATAGESGGTPTLEISYHGDRDDSRTAGSRMLRELEEVRREAWDILLVEAGLEVPPQLVFPLDEKDVATAAESSGLVLGRFLTTLLVMLLLSGGSVVAMDSLAGEKERGTLETLLTSSVSRSELVLAKSLSIFVVALLITGVNVANFLAWIGLELIPIPQGFAVPVDLPLALLVLFLYLPLAALMASLLLLLSGRARTYKEAQLLLFPLTLVCVAPTLVAAFPGLELRSPLVLVPISNLSLAVKQVLSGVFDWPFLALAWLTTAAAAGGLARLSADALSSERLITSSDYDAADHLGGEALFRRHVLRWFAALWAISLLVQLNFAPPRLDVRLLLTVNMALMLAAALLAVRVYRLDLRRALALRLPPWPAWLAVVLGVPSAAILGIGVGEVSGFFFPVPESWLEALNEALVPPDVPFWTQMLPLLSLLPGVCEELAFRGALLHGLHRRLRPLPLVLVVGGIFGLFHVDLFRILPTAFLGAVLAAVTLLTGSILPAIVWHAGNNALVLAAGQSGHLPTEPAAWHYVAATAVLAAAGGILWRWRRPYPGLRSRAERRQPATGPLS